MQAPKFDLLVTGERVKAFTPGRRMWFACPRFGCVTAAVSEHSCCYCWLRAHSAPGVQKGCAPVSLKHSPSSFSQNLTLLKLSRRGDPELGLSERLLAAGTAWCGHCWYSGTRRECWLLTVFLFTACAASPSCTWQCFVTKETLQ